MRIRFKTRDYITEWHDYFIWFPKIIRDSDTKSRFLVWLETVRCRRVYFKDSAYWQYKIKWETFWKQEK